MDNERLIDFGVRILDLPYEVYPPFVWWACSPVARRGLPAVFLAGLPADSGAGRSTSEPFSVIASEAKQSTHYANKQTGLHFGNIILTMNSLIGSSHPK